MEIRISVANLVPRLIVRETGRVGFIGLLNRKLLKRDELVYGAVGGAAELTEFGMTFLAERFDARFEKSRDARICVQMGHLGEVMQLFEARDTDFCEVDPSREIREELTTLELPNMPRILTVEEAELIEIRYVKSVYQAGDVTTERASAKSDDLFSQRYFHLFEMVVPLKVYRQLLRHPAVKIFTEADLASTRMGLVRGEASDGSIIGSNLFW
jgi:hypothetical protein